MIELLLTYPVLPLGTLTIIAMYILLSRGLRKAEDSDNETLDALVTDVEELTRRTEAVEQKIGKHGNELTKLALRGVK